MQNKNYQIALTGTNVSVSPDLTTYFGEGNLANYSNEEVTTILQEVSSTTDEDILKKRYIRLKQIYKTEVPYISLYFNKNIVAYSSNLVGNVRANWFNLFYNIESWYKK
jgi:ABC-type transport system substrate-binding protein